MGGTNGATFVLLAACAFTTEEIGPGALDTRTLNRLMDIKTNMFRGSKLKSFLIMQDT